MYDGTNYLRKSLPTKNNTTSPINKSKNMIPHLSNPHIYVIKVANFNF